MFLVTRTDFCRAINYLQAQINAGGGGGGTYTAGDGLDLSVGDEFSVDSSVARTTATLAQFAATTSAELLALLTNPVGTGFAVFSNSPTLQTPTIAAIHNAGAAGIAFGSVLTPVNYFQVTQGATGTGVTISATGSDTDVNLTLAAKGAGVVRYKTYEVGFRRVPSNAQSAAYSFQLTDSGLSVDHPAADANNRAFTLDTDLAWTTGDCITVTNMSAANNVTIPVSGAFQLYLAGTGSTGTRTLGPYGVATMRRQATGNWLIAGTALT